MTEQTGFRAIDQRARLLAKIAFAASGVIVVTSLVKDFAGVFVFKWFARTAGQGFWQATIEERAGVFRSVLEFLALVLADAVVPALVVSLIAVIALVIVRRAAQGRSVLQQALEPEFSRKACFFAGVAEVYAWVYLAFEGLLGIASLTGAGVQSQVASSRGASAAMQNLLRQVSFTAHGLVSVLLRFCAIMLAALVVKVLAGQALVAGRDDLKDMSEANGVL